WRKRFRRSLSLRNRSGTHRAINPCLGSPNGRRKARVVGSNHLHAFAPNLRSRESRRRRHVASAIHDTCSLDWIRTDSTPNAQRPTSNTEFRANKQTIKHQTSFWWWMFYLSLALGFLAKGPIAWTPLATVAVVIIYTRNWQSVWCFKFVPGILLTIAVVALWGIPALIQTHGEFFSIGI